MISVKNESKYFTKDQIAILRENNISMPTAIQRINRGWTVGQAIGEENPPVRRFNKPQQTPRRNKPSKYFSKDQVKYMKEKGIDFSTAIQRVNRGWTVQEALEIIPRKKASREFRDWSELQLALYKGDIFITSGTIHEIAEYMGRKIYSYKNLYYKTKRGELDETKNALRLIEIEGEEDE